MEYVVSIMARAGNEPEKERGLVDRKNRRNSTRLPKWKAALRRALDLVTRHASAIAMVLYLTGSVGGLLALTTAGRPGGVDEKAFTLGVARPQLGATKATDVMRLYHVQKDISTGSVLGDARAMWNECETHWLRADGRRHGLAWYGAGDGEDIRGAGVSAEREDMLDTGTTTTTMTTTRTRTGVSHGIAYDVVEATRSDGTESVLVVVPFTPFAGAMGMAVGHGLAWYLQEQEWLAKNVIIAYVDLSKSSLVTSVEEFLSTVEDRRIGLIGQAIILDLRVLGSMSDVETPSGTSIKVHGWNGRLPNLDLFIVTRKLAEAYVAGSKVTVHGASTLADSTWNKASALTRFLFHHGFGLADGGHGALLDQGIDALTVELSFQGTISSLTGVLQMTESLVRELNNLHERLHHATGLYALAGASAVVDIGTYTACPAMLAIACALKAYQLTQAAGVEDTTRASHVSWNYAVRWIVWLASAAVALYVNGHIFAARRITSSAILGPMSSSSMAKTALLPGVVATCAMAFCRIALVGAIISGLFVTRGIGGAADKVRWDAAVAWALCGVSVFLILYRWSLAWMVLVAFLPMILTK